MAHLPAISIRHLSKIGHDKIILSGLSLEVLPAEIFGLVGENGAGKTTLFKSILDFGDVETGEIRLFGVDHRSADSRQQVSFLPERFMPPYFLTGNEFLQYILTLNAIPYQQQEVELGLSELDLDVAVLEQPVRSYSKGMTQKLGLLSSFLLKKKLYILDEPMSGLDPKARALLKQKLCQVKERGGAVFFSSHALADIDEVCDRMAILHRGVLKFVGTPAACREHFSASSLEQAYLQCVLD